MLAMAAGRFSEKIREGLAVKGWTKYRLAKESGFSEPYVGQLEKGNGTPSVAAIKKFAEVLGVPLADMQAAADADELGPERMAQLFKHEGSALAKAEAVQLHINNLGAELQGLVKGPTNPQRQKRVKEIIATLEALEGMLKRENAELGKPSTKNEEKDQK